MTSDGNRLRYEKSPYLLQHADNPIHWFAWGEDAFAKARRLDRPIFLSIGYSTCHWCHVMEHESFEDSAVAEILNDHFVAIKVDREERPDIDDVYMNVCQLMTGSGGWPLTIIMAPDGKPFFAGTYIPKTARFGRTGLVDLLNIVIDKWNNDRSNIESIGDQATGAVSRLNENLAGATPGLAALETAVNQMKSQYDHQYGGFGGAPKFPMPHRLTAMLRWVDRSGDEDMLSKLRYTLRAMRRGGIYDQLGFGFCRYSTDPQWLVPHFEKMLYDNAGLAIAYTEMYQLTGEDEWRRTAEEIYTYVQRDMTSPEGAFYSAEDADSEGEEGIFYVWEPEEFDSILGAELANLVRRFWGVTASGNFEHGRTILHQPLSIEEFADSLTRPVDDVRSQIETARARIFEHREKREHPLKDDKVLTSWNGFMIAALSKSAQAFDEPRFAQAAARAADFVLGHLRNAEGRLLRRFRDGDAGILGYSEDYAFLVWGLIELYEATFEERYLSEAMSLNKYMLDLFWDDDHGGLYFTGNDAESLIVRSKEYADGAIPSANSVAALNLIRLGRMTGDTDLESRADALLQSFAARLVQSPISFMQAWWAVDFAVGPTQEIVIAAADGPASSDTMTRALWNRYRPRTVLLAIDDKSARIFRLAPFLSSLEPINGQTAVYVCHNFQCDLPVTTVDGLSTVLK